MMNVPNPADVAEPTLEYLTERIEACLGQYDWTDADFVAGRVQQIYEPVLRSLREQLEAKERMVAGCYAEIEALDLRIFALMDAERENGKAQP